MELSNLTLLSGETFEENVLGAVAWRQRGDATFQSALLHDFDMVVLLLHEEQETERINPIALPLISGRNRYM